MITATYSCLVTAYKRRTVEASNPNFPEPLGENFPREAHLSHSWRPALYVWELTNYTCCWLEIFVKCYFPAEDSKYVVSSSQRLNSRPTWFMHSLLIWALVLLMQPLKPAVMVWSSSWMSFLVCVGWQIPSALPECCSKLVGMSSAGNTDALRMAPESGRHGDSCSSGSATY